MDWDVKTITAGDYSIEFDLSEDAYDYWRDHYYDKTNVLPENAQFKLYLQNTLEDRLTACPNQGFEEEDENGESAKIKISQITMAYNNSWIVNMLTKRGTLIKTEKWEKVNKQGI